MFPLLIGIGRAALVAATLTGTDSFKTAPMLVLSGAKQAYLTSNGAEGLHLVGGQGSTIRYASSTDRGATFPVMATIPAKGLLLGMRSGPRVLVTPQGPLIMAPVKPGNLQIWHGTSDGQAWKASATVNQVPGAAAEGLFDLSIKDGVLWTAWIDTRAKKAQLYGARSTDYGRTWKEFPLYQSPSGSICECCHPSVAISPKNKVWIMWRNNIQNVRDMYLMNLDLASTEGQPSIKLGKGSWPIKGCPMAGGAIAFTDMGGPITIWRREGTIYLSRPSLPEEAIGTGLHPWLARNGKDLTAIWEDPDGKIVTYSQTRKDTTVLANQGSFPILTETPDGAVAAWETKEGIYFTKLP